MLEKIIDFLISTVIFLVQHFLRGLLYIFSMPFLPLIIMYKLVNFLDKD